MLAVDCPVGFGSDVWGKGMLKLPRQDKTMQCNIIPVSRSYQVNKAALPNHFVQHCGAVVSGIIIANNFETSRANALQPVQLRGSRSQRLLLREGTFYAPALPPVKIGGAAVHGH